MSNFEHLREHLPIGYSITEYEASNMVTVSLLAKSIYGYQVDVSGMTDHELADYPSPAGVINIWAEDGIVIWSDEHASVDVHRSVFDNVTADTDLIDWPQFENLLMAIEGYATAIIAEQLRVDGLTAGA